MGKHPFQQKYTFQWFHTFHWHYIFQWIHSFHWVHTFRWINTFRWIQAILQNHNFRILFLATFFVDLDFSNSCAEKHFKSMYRVTNSRWDRFNLQYWTTKSKLWKFFLTWLLVPCLGYKLLWRRFSGNRTRNEKFWIFSAKFDCRFHVTKLRLLAFTPFTKKISKIEMFIFFYLESQTQ